jgi:LytS/YehU family sensor histidine kinase
MNPESCYWDHNAVSFQQSFFRRSSVAGKRSVCPESKLADQIKRDHYYYLTSFLENHLVLFDNCFTTAAVLYYLHRSRINHIIQKTDVDKQLAQTEMKALHSQMNPHFIFNCLNSIREMILNNENEQASLYLSKFARLIRITLDHSSRAFVSLEDTIDYLKRYLEMEHIRKSNFSYNIDVDENLLAAEIFLPPMLIQPFIENAIWHGAIPDKELHLDLKFKREQDALVCIIDDDGMGIEISLKNKEPELNYHSVGISNIKQRIHVLNEKYNLQSTIEIRDKSAIHSNGDTGTIVSLHLPIKTNEPLL